MARQEFHTVDVVRLEVEADPTGLVNLIQNPNGELGGWGWITPVPESVVRFGGTLVGGASLLKYQSSVVGATAQHFTSEPLPVAAGEYVAASWQPRGGTAGRYHRASLEWLDAAQALLSTSAPGAYVSVSDAGAKNHGPIVAPASTAYVRLRFDLYDTSSGGDPAATDFSFNEVTVATAATSGELGTVRTNLVPNPSFETDVQGWTAAQSSTIVRSTALAAVGAASLLYTHGASAGVDGFVSLTAKRGMPVSAGQSYALQLRSWALVSAQTLKVTARWYDAAGDLLSSSATTGASAVGAWSTYSRVVTAPAGAAYLAVSVGFDVAPAAGDQVHFDAFMVEQSGTVGAYFDGSTPDADGWDYSSTTRSPLATLSRTNLILNPSFETDTASWIQSLGTGARSTAQAWAGSASLAMTATGTQDGVSVRTANGTAAMPVVAGETYTLSAYARSATVTRSAHCYIFWVDSAGAFMSNAFSGSVTTSTSAWTRVSVTATAPAGAAYAYVSVGVMRGLAMPAGEVHYIDAIMLERATSAGEYFDGATADTNADYTAVDRAWTGTAHASTSTETHTVTLPYSTAVNINLGYIEPVEYLNVMGESHRIGIRRQGLNVGELTATILSSALDPAEATLIRPGRRARLTALISGVWKTVIAGKLLEAGVTYELKDPKIPAEKRARIEVSILDPIQALANTKRPEGVATIAELPFVLEGAGVPWNVNGSGDQVATADVTTYNDGASALTQAALARDTALGYVWMSRVGVLTAYDAAQLPAGAPLVLDEDDYSDLNVSFSTRDCINEVSVVVQSLGVDGTTVETTYGPYRDSASIAEWGAFSKTFTVTGLDSTAVDALAAAVLAANATPRVRVNALTLALRTIEQLEAKALIDLYDEVQVVNVAKGISDTLRVTELEHAISTDKWLVRLEFGDEGAVASPVFQPPVQSGARPDVGVIELFAGPTGNIPATKLLCDGASYAAADYPHLFAVIGYVFGGSGDFFNVPNLVDRFPIGAGTKALGTSGGASTKTLTSANLPPHAHSIDHAHQSVSSPDTGGSTLAFLRSGNTNTTTGGGMVDTHAGNSGNGPGTSTPVDVMNPWLSINYVIRAA